jgi:endonuclease/exonuclease/phosphatase family metal-dependent hydrolase
MRILTWNLWGRFGDWKARRHAIRAVLAGAAPDVCGLQEVWQDPAENLAGWLAAELGYQWVWAPTVNQRYWQQRVGDDTVWHGVAVLSRWPVEHTTKMDISPADGRVALGAVIRAPHAPIPLITAHLSARGGVVQRCAQVDRVLRLSGHLAAATHPLVLTGDFNVTPSSEVAKRLEARFLDVWHRADAGDPGHTWNAAGSLAGRGAAHRVDYIYVGNPNQGGTGRVLTAGRAGTAPVNGVWPSDHAAVVADLQA